MTNETKNTIWKSNILCCICCLVAFATSCGKQGPANSTSAGTNNLEQKGAEKKTTEYSIRIVVEKETISVDGKSLSRFPKLDELESLFGKADRKSELANHIYTWDKLGVIAYRNPKEEKFHCLSVFYSKPQFDYHPANRYSGCIQIEKQIFDRDSTTAQLANLGFNKESYAPALYSTEQSKYSIFYEISAEDHSFSYTWK